MTTTEYAAQIRQALKRQHGWSSRQVSVRAEYFSLGSSIEIVVKDPSIPLPAVKAIAQRAESIRRDEMTGEILGGGNRYVSVTYSHEAQEIIGRRYADAVQRAVLAVDPGSNVLRSVEGTPFLVGRPHEHRITLWEDAYLTEGSTVEHIAGTIGSLLVARQLAGVRP
jgi:hypothetical protein